VPARLKYFHEIDATNRLKGNAGLITLVPFSASER
jgi:hypothetical protein